MAMTVMHNAGAQVTAGELNKNDTGLKKALSKLSTGQKIVGADDDSSGYSISERMRMKIRALTQDDRNVQNGSSMIRTAERGVDRIVQTLRTMKELAIDAANDSNTDEDRAIIQKELDRCIETIDDIALGTEFNGKILLDGRWAKGGTFLPTGGAGGAGGANTTAQNVVSGFKAGGGNSMEVAPTTNGGYGDWQFTADKQFTGGNISVELDFSAMTLSGSYPDALAGQGFTILCEGCPQYVNIIFDVNRTSAQSTFNNTPGVAEDGSINPSAREYVIGVKGVNNAKALSNAIYEGIVALKGKNSNGAQVDSAHNLSINQDSSGRVFLTKSGPDMQFLEGTIPNPLTLPIEPVKMEVKIPNPLWIQAGTQAGQRTHIFIEDLRIEALGIDKADVTTQPKANDTIGIINSAIEIALEEATNLGAYLNRMEYTGTNIATMNDNVQASESTIRDADMAKEMVTYTKSNLLRQSSQTMFAQANQNGEAVLGLLQ